MLRKLFLSLLGLLLIAPALAQIAPIRIPVMRPPVVIQPVDTPSNAVATVPQINPVFDVANDPERARADHQAAQGQARHA